MSMVNESYLTYTQHITMSNTYVDCIHISRPIENYRRVTERFGEIIVKYFLHAAIAAINFQYVYDRLILSNIYAIYQNI